MFENNELARALTELPDELLLEAEHTARPGKTIPFRRLIAAAAVIALLAATVGAVSMGMNWSTEQVSRQDMIEEYGAIWEEYYDGPESMGFDKLEYTVPLEVVELKQRNMDYLKDLLRRHWNLTQQADYAAFYDPEPNREFVYDSLNVDYFMMDFMLHYNVSKVVYSFESLEDVENLLGILFDVPQQLRDMIRNPAKYDSSTVWVSIRTGVTEAQAAKRKGSVDPSEVIVHFQYSMPDVRTQATGTIVIPLTEQAARDGLQGLSYSYEKEGAIWQEEQTIGEWNVTLFGNDPQEGFAGWCEAVYTRNGIGYQIEAYRQADSPAASAKEILLPLFADAE